MSYGPPGRNEKGGYSWLEGLRITDVDPPPMPNDLLAILEQGRDSNANSSEQSKNDKLPYKNTLSLEGATSEGKKSATTATNRNKRNIFFSEPGRDETLFHIASALRRGGMDRDNISEYLTFLGQNCKPPFPQKEINTKIESVFKRAENRNKGLTAEIREWVSATWGNITATEALQTATNATFEDRKKIRVILGRLVKEGVLERVPERNGVYRKINNDCPSVDFINATTEPIDLWLPFGLTDVAGIHLGNVLVFAGEKDSGKTSALMNIALKNRNAFNVSYFTSEMSPGEFRLRASKSGYPIEQWKKVALYERAGNFEDVVKPGEGNLNIIDFLEKHDNFYTIGADIQKIHAKLDGAIAVIALQKDKEKDLGRGGGFGLEKARLYVALSWGKAKCISCKNFRENSRVGNPRGMEYTYKIFNGFKYYEVDDWHKPGK